MSVNCYSTPSSYSNMIPFVPCSQSRVLKMASSKLPITSNSTTSILNVLMQNLPSFLLPVGCPEEKKASPHFMHCCPNHVTFYFSMHVGTEKAKDHYFRMHGSMANMNIKI